MRWLIVLPAEDADQMGMDFRAELLARGHEVRTFAYRRRNPLYKSKSTKAAYQLWILRRLERLCLAWQPRLVLVIKGTAQPGHGAATQGGQRGRRLLANRKGVVTQLPDQGSNAVLLGGGQRAPAEEGQQPRAVRGQLGVLEELLIARRVWTSGRGRAAGRCGQKPETEPETRNQKPETSNMMSFASSGCWLLVSGLRNHGSSYTDNDVSYKGPLSSLPAGQTGCKTELRMLSVIASSGLFPWRRWHDACSRSHRPD